MTEHTPSPWAVGQYTPTENFRAIENHACVCKSDTMMLIAVCGRAEDEASQRDADLISAAPEMLAVLKLMVNDRRLFPEYSHEFDGLLDIAWAVINKAEGRS